MSHSKRKNQQENGKGNGSLFVEVSIGRALVSLDVWFGNCLSLRELNNTAILGDGLNLQTNLFHLFCSIAHWKPKKSRLLCSFMQRISAMTTTQKIYLGLFSQEKWTSISLEWNEENDWYASLTSLVSPRPLYLFNTVAKPKYLQTIEIFVVLCLCVSLVTSLKR